MRVFISHLRADSAQALKLQAALQQENIDAWLRQDREEPINWRDYTLWHATQDIDKLEQAIQASDAIIVMVGSDPELVDEPRLEWRLALESVWQDPNKRMIPFLLDEAETPAFVRSSVAPEESLPVVRAREPEQDWEQAVKTLVAILRNEADWSQVEQVPSVTEQDREEQRRRQAEILRYVETLRTNTPLTETAAERRSAGTQP